MIEILTGSGLAASAGLNAYVPLLVLGLLSRFTDAVTLPAAWQWVGSTPALIVLTVLLVLEVVADKVPAVDSVNDVVQTVVRPASGGIVFAAGAGSTTVSDPSALTDSHVWVPVVAGVLLALVVHGGKAMARPVANVSTAGLAAPVLSVGEDVVSLAMSLLALLAPVVAALLLVGLVVGFVTWWRRLRRPSFDLPDELR